jgi:putative redox protein
VATAKVYARHVDGHTLIARAASHHWIPIDSPAEGGTLPSANSPVQLLLIGCAGCVMIDTVNILTKSRQEFHEFEINLEAGRRDTPPYIVQRLEYHVHLNGPALREETVRRAVELSLSKYCSVSLSLDRNVRFFAQITLNGTTGARWEIPRNHELYEEAVDAP